MENIDNYENEYYNMDDIDKMIEEYNKNFENDCINNNYPIFYYKFSEIIKESRIRELEELRSKQIDPSEINRYKQSIQSKNDELENLRSRLNQAENRLKDVQYFESENRRLAELLVKREREIEGQV
jgi:hypothetical protein